MDTAAERACIADIDLNACSQRVVVLGLRFFMCGACETVYADVERPPQCCNCDGEPVEEIGPGTQAADYFTGR